MKNKMIYLLVISSIFLSAKCKDQHEDLAGQSPSAQGKDSLRYPIDLALIYHGGSQRRDWNKDQMRPYVYRMKDGQLQWLFDGFLFLEITTNANGQQYSFVVNTNPADKEQWQTLLDRTFAAGHGPDALEQLLDSLEKKKDIPPYRRKVVISIPNPAYGDTSWGALSNKNLDFNNDRDRITAATWFVNQALEIWKSKKYKHLKLAGFYWVHEAVANQSDANVIQAMSNYLHDNKLDFYWIPYYNAGRAGDWNDMGFDIAYQQPNYFFNLTTPYSRLPDAINFAKQHKMAYEMEFDGRLMTSADYRKRFYDYLNEFKKGGVWAQAPVAYYEGGGAWLDMSRSDDPEAQKAFNALGDILAERKEKGIHP